jgi:hypothetical protein
MLAHFLNILSQKTGQQVKVQLLQTLSILITGIKSETHLCTPRLLFAHTHKRVTLPDIKPT